MHFDWLQSLIKKSPAARRAPAKRQLHLGEVETLETRVVPAIYTVTGYADGTGTTTADGADFNSTTLRAALTAANATPEADTIVLSAGTYSINTDSEGQLDIGTYDLTINGAGADQTVIDNAGYIGRVLMIEGGAEVTLQGLQITGGNLTAYASEGAGIFIQNSTLHLIASSVVNNQVNNQYGAGGGIANYGGTLTITDSTIADNQVTGDSSNSGYGGTGGGISTRFGSVTIENSTISGNLAQGGTASLFAGGQAVGGGIYSNSSDLTIINSTIADNLALGGQSTNGGEGLGGTAYGGGIYAYNGTTSISNSTIAFNEARGGIVTGGQPFQNGSSSGGGVLISGESNVGIASTIIAQNIATINADVAGVFTDADYNLIGDVGDSEGWTGENSLIGGGINEIIDPLFATTILANNGGPTLTLALLPTSPAIDAGFYDHSSKYDQRGEGFTRTVGPAPDIGAFEVQSTLAVATSAGSTSYIAGGSAVIVDPGVTVICNYDLTGATVSFDGQFTDGEDVLTYPIQIGNITGSYSEGVLTLSGTDTVANYILALSSITYSNTNPEPTGNSRSILFSVTNSDGTADAETAKTVTITINNEVAPAITVTEEQGTYYLGKDRAFVDPTAGFTNEGSETPDYSAAQLLVSIVSGRSRRDTLSILSKGQSGPIHVKGKNLFYGDVKIGTISGGKGRQPNLVVTFNAQTTTASLDALMRRVNFTAKDQIGTLRTVNMQIVNIRNGGLETVDSNVATRDIQVVSANKN